jgi:uncharacterized protein
MENSAASSPIDAFLACRTLAVIGASRDPNKFGHAAFVDLLAKGYTVYPVNPNASDIEGRRAYASIAALPPGVEGLVLVVPPAQSEEALREARAAGIMKIWMQPGAESAEAVRFGLANGMIVLHGLCIMMQDVRAPGA